MKIRIKYINGMRFKRFILTSAQRINQTEYHLNDINVFPVADGDTGTNLAITMNNIVMGVRNFRKNSFEEMIQRIAKAALMGARGNSGAILAQFFQGLAEETRGMSHLTTIAFSQAAVRAAEQATMAIANPCEGTIITVMKDWAYYMNQLAHKTPDFVELFKQSLKKAKTSLFETPNKLAILKRAGVVDAGAEGFVNLLEGIVDFIEFGKLKTLKNYEKKCLTNQGEKSFLYSKKQPEFRYCTECLAEGQDFDKDLIKQKLDGLGDSQVIAGSNEQVRIHIHTNQPDFVISQIGSMGQVIETKVDDMWEQTEEVSRKTDKLKIALGLIVLQAARMIEKGLTMKQIVEKLEYHIQHSKIFVSVPSLKYLIKSGRLNRAKGLIGSIMHLKLVITLNQQGAFEEAAKVVGYQRLLDKTLELASQFAESMKNPCFAIAHIQDIQLARWYNKELKSRFPQAEIVIAEGSPALSVHIGKSGTAIAVMGNQV